MNRHHLLISISNQKLHIVENTKLIKSYQVSTAKNGSGCTEGSGCTPLGKHKIKLKIGAGCLLNSVFVARRPTGEIYSQKIAGKFPDRDWILTRIIWLDGMEYGVNKGSGVDSLRRFIYIHGTANTDGIGMPESKGCIRMRNTDILELFDMVDNGMLVWIKE